MLPNKTITIPIPQPLPHMYRGFTYKDQASIPLSIRWTDADKDYIEKQAAKLGMTFSEFVRWCAYYCAREMFDIQLTVTNAARRAAIAQERVNKDEYTDDTQ